MTQRERDILQRIYKGANALASAGPSNPADIGGLARHSALTRKAGGQLALAISCLGFGDYRDADDYLDDFEEEIERDRGR